MDSESVKKIASLLQAPDVRSRRQAIVALGKSNHPDALKHLNWAVRNESDEELRALATQAIYDIRQANQDSDADFEPAYIPSPVVNDDLPAPSSAQTEPQPTTQNKVDVYRRDYVLVGMMTLMLVWMLIIGLSGDSLILFDRLVLVEGDTVGDRVGEIQDVLRTYGYHDLDAAFAEIEQINGRLNLSDIIEFYNRRIGANLIIRSGLMYYTYTDQMRRNDDRIGFGWYGEREKRDVYNYTVAFVAINGVMVLVGVSMFVGLLKSSQTFLFRAVRFITLVAGLQAFWIGVFIISVVQIALLGMIYLEGFSQFLYDLLIALGWKTGNISPRDLVGYQFFIIFAIWGVIATIALGSILFHPQQTDIG
jgi:hypothetical protein